MVDQTFSAADAEHMQHVLKLAKRGLTRVTPNPAVGCVLVNDKGERIAEGFHQQAGEAHAEILAIEHAKMQGIQVKGLTVYVTLEPCNHDGKTGPCTEVLIAEKVSEVVYAVKDPNPQVAGEGLKKLEAAGVSVRGPLLEKQAVELNKGFFKRMKEGLPYVTLKMAMSLDGKIALKNGESKWITGKSARANVQTMRSLSCAVMTSVATVNADNPSLNVRSENSDSMRQPHRIILDSNLLSVPQSKIFSNPGMTIVAHKPGVDVVGFLNRFPDGVRENIELWEIKESIPGRLDLIEILKRCGRAEINYLMIEAGARLAGEFIEKKLVDEIVVFQAPVLLGEDALSAFDFSISSMAEKFELEVSNRRQFGDDERITFALKNRTGVT